MGTQFWSENLNDKKNILEVLGVCADDFEETRSHYIDWSHQAQDRPQRWALLNTVMNLRIFREAVEFLD
jgi:hypothetical protein